MEIRVQFPRERAGPTGSVRKVRPAGGHEVDPGEHANDRRQNDRREDDGREHQPSPDADIGGHVDKMA
ncbi:MAG: hypothetical protein WCA36_06970 [Pseudolabrys sp.]